MANLSKFLCYLDILGFKNRIAEKGFKRCYESVMTEVKNLNYGDNVFLISDSIIVIAEDFEDLVHSSFSIYSTALDQGIFLRGAVTKGQINELSPFHKTGTIIVIPYLGEAYLRAHELEQEINCAAICIDPEIFSQLDDEEKKLIFGYTELFPKNDKEEKLFLISDMDNWSVPKTILLRISEQIDNLSKHDLPKFLDTFCLYYKVMKVRHDDINCLEVYHKWWIDILNKL